MTQSNVRALPDSDTYPESAQLKIPGSDKTLVCPKNIVDLQNVISRLEV